MAVENIIAENKRNRVTANEITTNQKGLGNAFGAGLRRIADLQAKPLTIFQETPEAVLLMGGRNDKDLTNPRQHKRGERVIDHRFIVDWHELFADCPGNGIQPRARAAGEDNTFHALSFVRGAAPNPRRSRSYLSAPIASHHRRLSTYQRTVCARPCSNV